MVILNIWHIIYHLLKGVMTSNSYCNCWILLVLLSGPPRNPARFISILDMGQRHPHKNNITQDFWFWSVSAGLLYLRPYPITSTHNLFISSYKFCSPDFLSAVAFQSKFRSCLISETKIPTVVFRRLKWPTAIHHHHCSALIHFAPLWVLQLPHNASNSSSLTLLRAISAACAMNQGMNWFLIGILLAPWWHFGLGSGIPRHAVIIGWSEVALYLQAVFDTVVF